MRKEDYMKWSELFASILGDKDVDVSQPTVQSQSIQQPSVSTPEQPTTTPTVSQQNTEPSSQQNSSAQNVAAPNLTQESFDALNKRIAELESANRDLLMNGTARQQPAATPESLIYSLCVERNNHGKQTGQNSNTN